MPFSMAKNHPQGTRVAKNHPKGTGQLSLPRDVANKHRHIIAIEVRFSGDGCIAVSLFQPQSRRNLSQAPVPSKPLCLTRVISVEG